MKQSVFKKCVLWLSTLHGVIVLGSGLMYATLMLLSDFWAKVQFGTIFGILSIVWCIIVLMMGSGCYNEKTANNFVDIFIPLYDISTIINLMSIIILTSNVIVGADVAVRMSIVFNILSIIGQAGVHLVKYITERGYSNAQMCEQV